MGAPKQPRVRRVHKNTVPKRNHLVEKWRNGGAPKVRSTGRPPGVADGYTKKQTAVLRAAAEVNAERIIQIMEEDGILDPALVSVEAEKIVDDEKAAARVALKEAITMVLVPGNAQTKLGAIRTVLEWTKSKPASKSDVSVNAAEEFLGALLLKDKHNG